MDADPSENSSLASARRIAVVGNSGSGKSTLARGLARSLGADHVEIDAILWLPGWTKRDPADIRRMVEERTSAGSWVADGNTHAVRDLVWGRADTIVVFDLPRRVVMGRVLRRTFGRFVRREELWAGNRETLRNVLALWDRDRSIIAWSWTKHAEYRREWMEAGADPRWAGKRFVFLRRARDAETLLAATACPSPT